MTHGRRNNDTYRERTQQIVPAMVSGRQTCAECRVHMSIGQFPHGSDVCVKCKPQGPNFRRGDIARTVANFQENRMAVDEQKLLKLISQEPQIRTMMLADRLDCDIEALDDALAPLLERGIILAAPVMAPNNRRATGYTLSDQARGEIIGSCTGTDIDPAPRSSLVKAMDFLQANPGATSGQLHAHLGLAPDAMVSTELADALADGRLVKDGKNWTLGSPAETSPFAALDPAPAPPAPAAPRPTKGQIAVDYLMVRPGQRCTQEQMRVAIGLPAGGQPGPYLKTALANGQLFRLGTDWVLAQQQGAAEPAPKVGLLLEQPPAADEHEALTFAPMGGIGNVKSDAPGSGARYNSGKADFSLIPLFTLEDEARVWMYGKEKYSQRGDCTCDAANAIRKLGRRATDSAGHTTSAACAQQIQSSQNGSGKTDAPGMQRTPSVSRLSKASEAPSADSTLHTSISASTPAFLRTTDLTESRTTSWSKEAVQSAGHASALMSTTVTPQESFEEFYAIPATLALDLSKGLMTGLAAHSPTCGVHRTSKSGAWNWLKGMDWSVPYACAMRHMAAWQRGEEFDAESGMPHLAHAICNLRMLTLYAKTYQQGDDRPAKEMLA